MNQGPYNRRSSSRRRSDLARRQEGNKFNSRRDSNVRDQYEQRGSRYNSSGPPGGGGSGGIKINSNSIAILAGVLVVRWARKYRKSAAVGYGGSRSRFL